jgi:hypothetical protein
MGSGEVPRHPAIASKGIQVIMGDVRLDRRERMRRHAGPFASASPKPVTRMTRGFPKSLTSDLFTHPRETLQGP